jgi:hypothetical protein
MSGTGLLHHAAERFAVGPWRLRMLFARGSRTRAFENTGSSDLVIWALGNCFPNEVCLYPDQVLAFVEGLGADVPLDQTIRSEWIEERRPR